MSERHRSVSTKRRKVPPQHLRRTVTDKVCAAGDTRQCVEARCRARNRQFNRPLALSATAGALKAGVAYRHLVVAELAAARSVDGKRVIEIRCCYRRVQCMFVSPHVDCATIAQFGIRHSKNELHAIVVPEERLVPCAGEAERIARLLFLAPHRDVDLLAVVLHAELGPARPCIRATERADIADHSGIRPFRFGDLAVDPYRSAVQRNPCARHLRSCGETNPRRDTNPTSDYIHNCFFPAFRGILYQKRDHEQA